MRQLLPAGPGTEVDLHAFYASDGWLDDGGVRVNFIASADGAATVAGLSRGLQTPGDNRVFANSRRSFSWRGRASLVVGIAQVTTLTL